MDIAAQGLIPTVSESHSVSILFLSTTALFPFPSSLLHNSAIRDSMHFLRSFVLTTPWPKASRRSLSPRSKYHRTMNSRRKTFLAKRSSLSRSRLRRRRAKGRISCRVKNLDKTLIYIVGCQQSASARSGGAPEPNTFPETLKPQCVLIVDKNEKLKRDAILSDYAKKTTLITAF